MAAAPVGLSPALHPDCVSAGARQLLVISRRSHPPGCLATMLRAARPDCLRERASWKDHQHPQWRITGIAEPMGDSRWDEYSDACSQVVQILVTRRLAGATEKGQYLLDGMRMERDGLTGFQSLLRDEELSGAHRCRDNITRRQPARAGHDWCVRVNDRRCSWVPCHGYPPFGVGAGLGETIHWTPASLKLNVEDCPLRRSEFVRLFAVFHGCPTGWRIPPAMLFGKGSRPIPRV